MKDKAKKIVDDLKEDIKDIIIYLKENPEIGFEEYLAKKFITDKFKKYNFEIEETSKKLPTSFKAIYNKGKSNNKFAFLLEYDALPEVGHGCGHNMIAGMSFGAAVALSKLDNCDCEITAIGCPGEENGGGKVILAEEGIFNYYDIAMLVHPATVNIVYTESNALDAIEFNYFGKETHAAATPEKGINALDAVILLFNGINALREHLKSDVRIHGIISEGGKAANVVPGKATARFYFRAQKREYLDEVVKKALKIAEGASLMTGAKLEWNNYELSNDNLSPSKKLSEIYKENLKSLGINEILPGRKSFGSTDVGNVSRIIPTIHPYIAIAPENSLNLHHINFTNHTVTEEAINNCLFAVKSMVLTAIDLIEDPNLLIDIKEEFKNRK